MTTSRKPKLFRAIVVMGAAITATAAAAACGDDDCCTEPRDAATDTIASMTGDAGTDAPLTDGAPQDVVAIL